MRNAASVPGHDQDHDASARNFLASSSQKCHHVLRELRCISIAHFAGSTCVVNSPLVKSWGVWINQFFRHLGKPLKRIRRMREMEGCLREQSPVEGSWHASHIVRRVRWQGSEEGVEIVGCVVVEQDLEIRQLGGEAL